MTVKVWSAPGSTWSAPGSLWSVGGGGTVTTRGVMARATRPAPRMRRAERAVPVMRPAPAERAAVIDSRALPIDSHLPVDVASLTAPTMRRGA